MFFFSYINKNRSSGNGLRPKSEKSWVRHHKIGGCHDFTVTVKCLTLNRKNSLMARRKKCSNFLFFSEMLLWESKSFYYQELNKNDTVTDN